MSWKAQGVAMSDDGGWAPEDMPEWPITVKEEWLDYNGHMNMGFYLVAFDFHATDPFYEWIGLGEDYIDGGMSVFTVSAKCDYFAEAFAGDEMAMTTRLVGHDHRRIHYAHTMYRLESDGTRTRVALNECIGINVDMEIRRSASFPPLIADRLTALAAHQADEALPREVGRSLSL